MSVVAAGRAFFGEDANVQSKCRRVDSARFVVLVSVYEAYIHSRVYGVIGVEWTESGQWTLSHSISGCQGRKRKPATPVRKH